MEDPVDMTIPPKKKAAPSSKKIPLAPSSLPPPAPETPVDAVIRDPVAFLKNSMQQEYNEKVAEKVTEAIRRDSTPPAKMLQELSNAHKLAENIATHSAPPPQPSTSRAAKKVAAAPEPSLPPNMDPDAKKMLACVQLYSRYRDTYADKIPDIQWLNDANFARLPLGDMYMKLELVRRSVNLGSKRGNPVKGLFSVAVDAIVQASVILAQTGTLDPSYDLSGSMTNGASLKKEIQEMMEKGELDSELTQIWVEYADWFNMGPFQRLALALANAASAVHEKNKKGMVMPKQTNAPPRNTSGKFGNL